MNFLKTTFYTSISTGISFLSGFVVIKIIAVKIGPGGFALLGMYQNIAAILSVIATFSIGVGVTKYLAEYNDNREYQQKIISTASFTVFLSSIVTSFITILLSRTFSQYSFHNTSYWSVYCFLGFTLIMISANSIFSAIFNGLKEIRYLTIINISANLINLCFTILMANIWGVFGILLASNITAIVLFAINLVVFTQKKLFSLTPSYKLFEFKYFKLLFTFTMLSIFPNLLTPLIQMANRKFIISNLGAELAGIWQAMNRISDYYLLFITSSLGVYYLPKFSQLKSLIDLKNEIIQGYKMILPIVGILSLSIFLCRNIIIALLFTKSFLPMKEMFLFQMVGDFLKIGSWLFGYLLVAKAKIKHFIILEIIFNLSLYFLNVTFLKQYGLVGASYAFALNYLFYWIATAIVVKKTIFYVED